MRRFIPYCMAVFSSAALFAFLNDRLNLALVRSSSSNPIGKMERFWSGSFPNEIMVFGSSRAQSDFVPSRISDMCFNYGFDGMAMRETVFLLKEISKRNGDMPIIVNFDPWGFSGYETKGFVGDYRLAPKSGQVSMLQLIPGVRFHGTLKRNFADWLNQRRAVTKVMDKGAVLIKNGRTPEEWKAIKAKAKPLPFERNENGEKEFEAAIAALAPRKVVVVVAPCTDRFMELFPNMDELGKYLTHLEAIGNVSIVDLFGDKDFTYADFTDNTHLNINGAIKFTEKFLQMSKFVNPLAVSMRHNTGKAFGD